MKIFEAMVNVSKGKCPMCAPGTTLKGTHENIIHMTTSAHTEEDAKIWFKSFGTLYSKVREVNK